MRLKPEAFVMVMLAFLGGMACPASAQPVHPLGADPDPTRRDSERLPPEAIQVNRGMYAHGWFVEGHVGARGMRGGAGEVSAVGPYMSLGGGYELLPWLWTKVGVELSLHATDAPPPPSPTAFEMLAAFAQLRAQLAFSARAALWLAAETGLVTTTGDILPIYGFTKADDLTALFGGQIGFDWHFIHRHYSVGLALGGRFYPGLDRQGGTSTLGLRSSLYLRYVL